MIGSSRAFVRMQPGYDVAAFRGNCLFSKLHSIRMVGAEGFEPPALCSQSRCATRLRYAPMSWFDCNANPIRTARSDAL